MVKKITFLLFLFTFLLITDVKASTVGGYEADSPLYAVVSSNYNNVPVRLWTPNIFGDDIVDYGSVVNDYVYITACTDMPTLGYSYVPFYNNTTGGTASATDIRYTANLTSKTCTFNTGAQGKVAYIKFRLVSDLLNVPQGSSNNTWLYNDYITFYIGTNSAFSFSIQNISSLDADLDIYSNDFDVSLLEQQNQQIINNQNNNTNSIINNQDSNTQDIIDNNNSNTQQQIESQKVCSLYDKNSIILDNNALNSQGSITSSTPFGITDYLKLSSSSELDILENIPNNSSYAGYFCFYNVNKEKISCHQSRGISLGIYSFPTDASYVRFSINKTLNKPQFKICTNGNQALNDSVNGLNDSITSTDTPNTNQDIDDMNDMVASDTPITDLLTLPLTLINAYYTGITSSCSPYNFGSLLGTDIVFPCINLEQRLGSNLWLIIDSLCCIFLIYSIAMLFVHAFDSLTSLKDDFDDMYVPRHAGKHVGGGING